MDIHPAYETVSNLVVVISAELRQYVEAYESGEFHGIHNEMPQVHALITHAQDIRDAEYHDLNAIQSWLLDVAIVGPTLWD